MNQAPDLLRAFEVERPRLVALSQRILGSGLEAEDVVQEGWIRLQKASGEPIEQLPAWLTTVVSRIAIDRLRARVRRRDQEADAAAIVNEHWAEPAAPEREHMLGESVGLALSVVLDRLSPRERVAFVLHDMFDISFADVANILECTPDAARQLASRARRSVRGVDEADLGPDASRKEALVRAFYAASRSGDLDAFLKVLAPNIMLSIDPAVFGADKVIVVRGAREVAKRAQLGAANDNVAVVGQWDGEPAILIEAQGRPNLVMTFTAGDHLITAISIAVAAPGAS